ncbi:MAG: POTRA domain-containing protein [Bacteroidota bacterium]|nr:POTRA domain-containing protein [Bacteroidota bacterium]
MREIVIRLSLFFFFLQIFTVNVSFAQRQTKIRNIVFSQSIPVYSEDFLLNYVSSKNNNIFNIETLEKDLEKLRHLYITDCYYFSGVGIDSLNYFDDSLFVNIFIRIEPHQKSLIRKIKLSGNTIFTTDNILINFSTTTGSCLQKTLLESDIYNLVTRYEETGYPLVSIDVTDISIANEESAIDVTLEIEEGLKIRIDKIHIEGNTETESEVIIRETRIQQGEFYSQSKIQKIPQRLNRMQLFSSISEPQIFLLQDSNSVVDTILLSIKKASRKTGLPASSGLLIKVTEANTNSFDGVVGYLPGSVSEKGYFTGLVDVTMRNLFGTARKLNVKWLKDERHSQEIGVRYAEPWFLNYPVNLAGTFFQRQQDTIYVRRFIELKSELMISDLFSVGVLFNQENIIPSSETATRYVNSSGTASIGFDVHYDSRDNIYNPTSGINYKSDYRYGRKEIYTLNSVQNVQRIGIDVEVFQETFRRQVVVVGLHGKELRASTVEVSDLFRFGGANTLRGYRENQFLGSRIIWSNLEYRFIVGSKSFFSAFFDAGYYSRNNSDLNIITESVKYGYGIGMRIETALGIIGVSLALGKGDTFNQAKIHFGLINEF